MQITNKGVSSLASFLKRTTFLKRLTLSLSQPRDYPGINDMGLLQLAEALKKQTCLNYINLSFKRFYQTLNFL